MAVASGGKGCLGGKKGLFSDKVHFLEILGSYKSVEKQGESDRCPEIRESLERSFQ